MVFKRLRLRQRLRRQHPRIYFGNEYETKDLTQINGGNDMYSYAWRKTTDENWDVYLAVADEHYDNEGGSIQFTQLEN